MEKKLILQNEVAEISKLAIFIEELGEEFGLSPELVFNLNLVLEEAVSNVILYAYPKEEHQTISLIARKKDVSPIETISEGCLKCVHASSVLWIIPSTPPRSTNTP